MLQISTWWMQSRRGQPLVDLSGGIDLPGFSQKLRAADAKGLRISRIVSIDFARS
ncbi:hypothetical protein ACVMFA_002410 [Bradyrhizobium liaoningense]